MLLAGGVLDRSDAGDTRAAAVTRGSDEASS
jgi:hypothetical protein